MLPSGEWSEADQRAAHTAATNAPGEPVRFSQICAALAAVKHRIQPTQLGAEPSEAEPGALGAAAQTVPGDSTVRRAIEGMRLQIISMLQTRGALGRTFEIANEEVRALLAALDAANDRIARMQREPTYREDAFALVEREMLEVGVQRVTVMKGARFCSEEFRPGILLAIVDSRRRGWPAPKRTMTTP
jgi:hypothetical protein